MIVEALFQWLFVRKCYYKCLQQTQVFALSLCLFEVFLKLRGTDWIEHISLIVEIVKKGFDAAKAFSLA